MDFFFLLDQHDKRLFTDLVSATLEKMWYYTTFEDELLEIEKKQVRSEINSNVQYMKKIKKRVKNNAESTPFEAA